MKQEKIDIFDTKYNKIGTATREEAHKKGLWHHTFHCWIINTKNKSILFQYASKSQQDFKFFLTPSTAGHIQSGEDIKAGIFREIKEEIGEKIKENELISKKYIVREDTFKSYVDKEFVNVFFIKKEKLLTDYNLDKREVKGLFEIKIEDGIALFSGEKKILKINGLGLNKNNYEKKELKINLKNFVPQPKNYYLNIFKIANELSKKND
ncbi:MAG: NUDIX hydrolase [Alphaproteobacteria bacterium]|nr:MAG: hypothetical protein B6I23_02465 [Rickettsiaceae bacterium 4572_127]